MEYKVFTDRNISRDIYELEVEGKRVLMFYFQRTIPTLGLNQSQVGDYNIKSISLARRLPRAIAILHL